ncbi:hypothetical protein [Emticicia fluvialis]|uniref:hypothetical protein n=1 Tax=Emticicia fluvialis TaxID=2974474 RepID=UPI00216657C7|nr:hypothetical protein [Emticicia fluvialis]
MQPYKTVTYGRFIWLSHWQAHCYDPLLQDLSTPNTGFILFLPVSKMRFPAMLCRKPGEIYLSNHFCHLPLHLLKIDNERL